jgi:hypothetical protein
MRRDVWTRYQMSVLAFYILEYIMLQQYQFIRAQQVRASGQMVYPTHTHTAS